MSPLFRILYPKNISNFSDNRRPSLKQWPKITRILTPKEKIIFFFLIFVFAASLFSWGAVFYYSKTEARPNYGGEYIEGIIGQPMHINPILSSSNDADADLSQIIYSSLFKYDGEGKLIPDAVESFEISEDKTVYTINLKKNILWHDAQALNAQDVLFSINLISDPTYKSPLRSNWQGVEVNAEDDWTITFKIKTPYAGFLNNLTFGILPKHIWESVDPDNFSLAELNLEPIGSGPYKYSSFQKDSKGNILSYKFISNPTYFAGKPYISKLTFNFYPDEETALDALNRKEIMGISGMSSRKTGEIKVQKSILIHKFDLPRYLAVFFNQTKSIPIASDEVREALDKATDRQEIISLVLDGNGQPVYYPFLPGMTGYDPELEHHNFDLEGANKLLEDKGWKKGDDGIREKNGVKLEITLTTTDWQELSQTAEILKTQWEKLGAKININTYSISDIQQNYIKPREYEALLFGQVLGADPDPYSFWNSTNKKDPGLNLSLFGDEKTDTLIEQGRTEFDPEKRSAIYIDFEKELFKEMPAIFLYSPEYIYPVNRSVKGIDIKNLILPSRRFSNINLWYIKTKRIWK